MRRILMVVDKPFIHDFRVRKEAFALAENGYGVTVVSLEPGAPPSRRVVQGVVVYTFPYFNVFQKSSRTRSLPAKVLYRALSGFGYMVEYAYFISLCLVQFTLIALREGFDAIHVNNPPAVICLVACIYKVLGKKIVFDHHDLEPELYLSRYRIHRNLFYWLLVGVEAASLRLADLVLATNESYKAIEMSRGGIGPDKIFVVRNAVDKPGRRALGRPAAGGRRPFILVYVGNMGPQDGVDYMLRSLRHLRDDLGRKDFRVIIIGEGDARADMIELCRELGLDGQVTFTGFIPRALLERHLASADICLDPNPSSPLNDHSTWIKVMEYMSYGKPVVSFDLKETRFSAREAAVYVPPNDVLAYARAIEGLMDDPERRERMGEAGYQRVTTVLTWERSRECLLGAYQWMFDRGRRRVMRALYYSVKPLVPRPLQILARRGWARRLRPQVADSWPIDRGSARAPTWWHGWPRGRAFALVLTHDVEDVRGMNKCLRVAEVEQGFDLRSSFNFVPERYRTCPSLRRDLSRQGFEIGVHDLRHDGRLYASRTEFLQNARRINGYLQAWGAVGFRSASMQHNLEWLRDLHIDYDCSTFDTDPFEPQPDGMRTIFPVWVSAAGPVPGYVELPYTLPQDMTLFVLLGERDIRIWREKLDWIAARGGMALIDTHPDYMRWEGEKRRVDEYPHELYEDFLRYACTRYQGQFWNALPRDVARYCRSCLANERAEAKGA